MPSRPPVPIKISTSLSVHTCACVFLLQLRIRSCLSLKRVLRKEQQLFSKRKSSNCSTMLVINFSIRWIYLISSCFYFTQIPRKMTKFVLNDLFEDIKLFLERANSSDQTKSSRLCFSPWSFTFKSLRCYTMSAKNSTVSLSLSFPKKGENVLAFLHILLTSRKKYKLCPEGPKSLQNSSLTQASFITVHK